MASPAAEHSAEQPATEPAVEPTAEQTAEQTAEPATEPAVEPEDRINDSINQINNAINKIKEGVNIIFNVRIVKTLLMSIKIHLENQHLLHDKNYELSEKYNKFDKIKKNF